LKVPSHPNHSVILCQRHEFLQRFPALLLGHVHGKSLPPVPVPGAGTHRAGIGSSLTGLRLPPPQGRCPERLSPLTPPRHPGVWDTAAHAGGVEGSRLALGADRYMLPARPCVSWERMLQTPRSPCKHQQCQLQHQARISPLEPCCPGHRVSGTTVSSLRAPLRQLSAQKALQSSVSMALQVACSCLGPPLVDERTRAHTHSEDLHSLWQGFVRAVSSYTAQRARKNKSSQTLHLLETKKKKTTKKSILTRVIKGLFLSSGHSEIHASWCLF